jgi:hypothetical protein
MKSDHLLSHRPHDLGENDLRSELERLERELKAGTLSTLAATRLADIRRCLKRLKELKAGADNYGF